MMTDICFPKQHFDEICRQYELELFLIEKVVNGEIVQALSCFEALFETDVLYADSDQGILRALKNQLLSLSGLLCHYVIQKGIPPYTAKAKNLSFGKLIESSPTKMALMNLGRMMVQAYSTQITSQITQTGDPSMMKAIHYIHNHLGEDLTLERVAEHVSLSRCYFCTQFKRETGVSFTQYLNQARIEKSKFLLSRSGKSILDIAILLGFNSQNYFATQFKKYMGVTPKQFRSAAAQ